MTGNFLVSSITGLLGFRGAFMFEVVLYIIDTYVFINAKSYLVLCIGGMLSGIHEQIYLMLIALVLNSYYKEKASFYISISYMGLALCPIIMPFLLNYVINPNNLKPGISHIEHGQEVRYFGTDIINNYFEFMRIQLYIHVIILVPLIYMFKDPPGNRSYLYEYLRYIFNWDLKKASIILKQSQSLIRRNLSASYLYSTAQNHSLVNFNITLNRDINEDLLDS